MNEYEGTRRIVCDIIHGQAQFIPVCETCGRFIKVDAAITFDGEGQPDGENATCQKCGRVKMIFEGYP